jgi:cytochrome c
MYLRPFLALLALPLLMAHHVFAVAASDEAQVARRLLDRAVSHYKQNGDAALASFSRQGEFTRGSHYVYVMATDGLLLASGGPSIVLVGRNVLDLHDVSGTPFIRAIVDRALTVGTGTQEYRWLNREHTKVERKIVHFERVGERILVVGYYVPYATPEQAKAMLGRAVEAVRADPEAAIRAFDDLNGSFVEDDLYVFAIDARSKLFLAHGANPRLVTTFAPRLRDANGQAFIEGLLDAVRDKDSGEVRYAWRNTVTSEVLTKNTFLERVGDIVLGVGYYTE